MALQGQKQANLRESTAKLENDQSLTARLERIEKALDDQYSILKEVRQNAEKTRRYILWGRVASVAYLLMIVLPIILAAIYLPPYLREFAEMFGMRGRQDTRTEAPLQSVQQLLQELKN